MRHTLGGTLDTLVQSTIRWCGCGAELSHWDVKFPMINTINSLVDGWPSSSRIRTLLNHPTHSLHHSALDSGWVYGMTGLEQNTDSL